MANDDLATVLPMVKTLIDAGAEVEQRLLDGTPVPTDPDTVTGNVFPLARTTFAYTTGHSSHELDPRDGVQRIWLRPLTPPIGLDDAGTPVFDGVANVERPIPFDRADVLGDGNVGFQHPSGTYSVIRPATDVNRQVIDAWDRSDTLY